MTNEATGNGHHDLRVEQSKFDLGGAPPVLATGQLPWGYGENRVTAIVRDPDSAYLYWEITDEAIASARDRLGPAGAQGWCNLRVYDTSGRIFDGTNANDYFDIRVDRKDRDYFVMIRRPTSTMTVEIGIKTTEGYFQPIARSGRADFPRNAPSPNTALDWMTITSDDAPPAVAPYRSRFRGPEPPLPGRAGAGYVDVWRAAFAPTMEQEAVAPAIEHPSWSGAVTRRTYERGAHIERWWHLDEWRAEWRGGLRFIRTEGPVHELGRVAWHEGPFPVALFDHERIAIELLREMPVHLHAEGTELTVFGPWRVVIRSFESEPHRRVLGTWSMHWVRAVTPMIERWGYAIERHRVSGYEREQVILGASERFALLERGASELWRLGASERMWLGASEWAMAGASETLFAGASQLAFAGASAFLYRGASEWMGASERVAASLGASERGGASGWIGASEWMGASAGGSHVAADPPDLTGERWAYRTEER
jgi:hypothetical protein